MRTKSKKVKYSVLNQVIFFSETEIPNIDNLITQGILEQFEIKSNHSYFNYCGIYEIDLFLKINCRLYHQGLLEKKHMYVTRVFVHKEKDLLLPAMICGGLVYRIDNNSKKLVFYKKKLDQLSEVIYQSKNLINSIDNYSNFLDKEGRKKAKLTSDKQAIISVRLKSLLHHLYSQYSKEFQIYPKP